MSNLIFVCFFLIGPVHTVFSQSLGSMTQVKKQKPKAGDNSKTIKKILKNLSPVTIEDIDHSEMFQLTADGKSTVPGMSTGTSSISEGQLVIQNLEGRTWKFPIEVKDGKLLIDHSSEAKGNADLPKNGHLWIVNTPE